MFYDDWSLEEINGCGALLACLFLYLTPVLVASVVLVENLAMRSIICGWAYVGLVVIRHLKHKADNDKVPILKGERVLIVAGIGVPLIAMAPPLIPYTQELTLLGLLASTCQILHRLRSI